MRLAALSTVALTVITVSAGAHAAGPPACAAVTVQDATAVLGVPATPGPAIGPMFCAFAAASGTGQLMVMVQSIGGAGPATMLNSMIKTSNRDPTHPAAVPVSGVGAQAAFFYKANGDFTLAAFQPGTLVQIDVQHDSGPTTPARESAMIAAAKKILADQHS